MTDQAERLRQIIENLKLKKEISQTEQFNSNPAHKARVIAVTSGKGGVGKSNVAVNLAIALSDLGQRVIILDADFGLSNVDILFGLTPENTLVDVMYKRKNILQVLSNGPKNTKFISGGSGARELVRLPKDKLISFIDHIKLLDRLADIIIIDTGAGLSDNVMGFLAASDEILLVATPEPTSITDAYAVIKMLSHQSRLPVIKLIVNRAESQREAADILNKLSAVALKFLNVKLEPLGYILNDENVSKAVRIQQPFYMSFPKSQATRNIQEISKKLLNVGKNAQAGNYSGVKGFFSRLAGFVGN